MKLTKYKHACFTLEKEGQVLVVDPGNWSTDFVVPNNIMAVVITHEHADHFFPETLAEIYDKNPDSLLVAHPSITEKMPDHKNNAVKSGDTVSVGPFSLEFFGGEHAVIHPSIPIIANLGVMIDNTLYYPGDSFTNPERPVEVLALPVSAPWMKISEAMDYVSTVKAKFVFPTHDAILSDEGKSPPDRMIPGFVEQYGGTYQRLTGPIEI